MMKKILTTCAGGLCLLAAIALTPSTAKADKLLTVDLTITNQVTISALNGLSAATVSGSDTTGFYMADFYAGPGTTVADTLVSGNLTSFLNTSDNTPLLFRTAPNLGLNVFSYTNDATSNFAAGTQAFTGSGTWTISAANYAEAIALGNRSGDIYFAADTDDDIPGATLLGTYNVIVSVPAPGAFALLGLAGVAGRRRRRS